MNKEMELIFKGSNPKWENIDLSKIVKAQDSKINGVKVQTIPDPEYVPTSMIGFKTIHSSIHIEFKYDQKTYETSTISNRFGVFEIDKHDKNIVEITFHNKFMAKKWMEIKVNEHSHSGIIRSILKEKLENL